MTTHFRISLSCATLALSTAFLGAQEALVDASAIFSDPEFKARFMGSYGFLPDVEPQMDPNNNAERKLFQQVGALLEDQAMPAGSKITSLQQLVTPDSNAALQFILANLYYDQNQEELAEKWYLSAIDKFKSFRRAHKNLGLLRYQRGNPDKALESLLRAVELGEFSSQVFGLLGICHLNRAEYLAAETGFRQALLLEPEKKDWKRGLLSAFMGAERYAEVNALVDQLLPEDPVNEKYWLMKAAALKSLNRDEEAIKAFEMLRLLGKAEPGVLEILGNLYMDKQKPNAALIAYQDALKTSTQINGSAVLRTANLLFSYDFVEQADKYVNLLASRGSELTREEQMDLRTLEAKIARSRGEDDRAATILHDIVLKDNRNGEARIELAQYYASKMRNAEDEAKEREYYARSKLYFDQALLIEGSEAMAALRYGQMLVGRREFVQAVPLLQRSLRSEPRSDVEQYVRQVERLARRQEAQEAADKKAVSPGE